jgi:hypothetical protein
VEAKNNRFRPLLLKKQELRKQVIEVNSHNLQCVMWDALLTGFIYPWKMAS